MTTDKLHLLAAAAVLAVINPCFGAAEPDFFRPLTFDAALKQAAAEKKTVFIDFYTTWCAPCKVLDSTTWQDKNVIALLTSKTIPLKIDAEKEKALAERYHVDAYPTLLLVKPDGSVIDRLVGYRDAAKFTSEFNDALAGKTALARARESLAGTSNENSRVQARYELAQTLARSGEYDQALKEYLWLFDEGAKASPAFVGVRTSFLLSSIVALGRQHAPALDALHARRDAAKASLSTPAADRSSAADFAAINHALNEDNVTLEVYDRLAVNSPARKILGRFVFEQLLAERRYADAIAAQPATESVASLDRMSSMFQSDSGSRLDESSRKVMMNIILENAGKEIEALAGAGKLDEARDLLKRVRAIDDSETTRTMLRQHLDRVGKSELLN